MYNRPVPRLQIIYASTSGHTEYVVERLRDFLKTQKVECALLKAERAKPEDLLQGDVLVLASGTWNTGGIEGQLNPHMHDFVHGRAARVDLAKRRVAIIALGDDRYFYTGRAGEHLRHFVQTHGGSVIEPALTIINEPYGQEKKVEEWGKALLASLPPRA
ncbi:MAG: hypothetical protein G01um101425_19 [Candidatus Peregrinibacteria bacterium Gr01-1014_25]|nr:MAG: hypothetical protein G01um101425_19 [Candidatus Peregrinibacteria bacterium Gr01-1014_25]